MSVDNLSGRMLGQYELRELLGAGGMGAVYQGYQASLRRVVAVKVLLLQRTGQADLIERFDREAMTVATLEHPNIVPIYDFGTQDGISYIIMRLLTGGSLAERLTRTQNDGKPLPSLAETSTLLAQLASALDYAHSQGVIHRDVKPGNVMFDNQDRAYLVDFGIAKLSNATSGLTGTSIALGTPSFMPPEQWRGDPITSAADQYSLGIMIYSLLTGHLPFEADTPYAMMHKHINEPPTPPTAWRTDLPPKLIDVINRAIAKNTADRFPNCMAFSAAFTAAVGSASKNDEGTAALSAIIPRTPSASAKPPTAATIPFAPTSTNRPPLALIAAGVLIALLAIGIGAFVVIGSNSANTNATGTQVAAQSSQAAINVAETQTAVSTATPTNTPTPTNDFQSTLAVLRTSTAQAITASAIKVTLTTPTSSPTVPTATFDVRALAQATLSAGLTATATAWTLTPTVDPNLLIAQELTRLYSEGQTQTATLWTLTPTPTSTFSPTPIPPTATPSVTDSPVPATLTPTVTPTLPPAITATEVPIPTLALPTTAPTDVPSATPTENIQQVTQAGTRLIVRDSPSTSGKTIKTLFVGDRLKLSDTTQIVGSTTWTQVTLENGAQGWIVVATGALITVDPTQTSPGFHVGLTVAITPAGDGLNLRESPSTDAKLVQHIKAGTTLRIIGGPQRGGFHMWWQFQLSDGTVGWIIDNPGWFTTQFD